MFYQDDAQTILNLTVLDILEPQNSVPTDHEIELFEMYFEDFDEQGYEKYIRALEEKHGKEWCRAVGYAVYNALLDELEKEKRKR